MKRMIARDSFGRVLCAVWIAMTAWMWLSAPAQARVTRIDVVERTTIAGDAAKGIPATERLVAKVHFAVKPGNEHNLVIVDLDKAPRNAAGEVEFAADLYLLRPLEHANGALFLEIPNRGGKGILRLVDGGVADPKSASEMGDAWLVKRGFAFASLGWQWDVSAGAGQMKLEAPVAHEADGGHIRGLLRSDWMPWQDHDDEPLGHEMGGRIGGTEYAVAAPEDGRNVLTVRETPGGVRQVIPRTEWSFAHEENGSLTPSDRWVHLRGGFHKGRIYELVYVVEDPVVAGLGFAAVRDFAAWMKHGASGPDGMDAPFAVKDVYAAGISQCGRFLRDFVYEGFNADERGRVALDGVLAHVGGAGRGSFNYRFAQPSRDAQPTTSLDYPTDIFPFTDEPEHDPEQPGARAVGLLDKARGEQVAPKMFLSHTSYEYWGRAASLIHTTADARKDVEIGPEVRIYYYTGLEHFSVPFPPQRMNDSYASQQLPTPLPIVGFWRAMIANMDAWVREGVAPPASRYPRLDRGELTTIAGLKFPALPGVQLPRDANQGERLDFGPAWREGVLSKEPPTVGKPFPVLVPQVDADGNEMSGVRLPEETVPLATYTGWNLRSPEIGSPELRLPFLGSFLPFAPTPEIAAIRHDPRPAVTARYADYAAYRVKFSEALDRLIAERYLLADSRAELLERSQREWDWVMAQR